MKKLRRRISSGILELILAMGIFVIIASGAVSSILTMNKSNLISSEGTKSELAFQEAYEAIRVMKKTGWDSLSLGEHGLVINNGTWSLSGSPDTVDGYTRTITIENARRNSSGGLVDSGGTEDINTKKITVDVSWEYAPGLDKNLANSFYISNWEQPVSTDFDGMLAYADYSGEDDSIKYKLLVNGEWSDEKDVPDLNVPSNRNTRWVELYDDPNSDQVILLTKHTEDGQFLYAQVWDGNAWGNAIQLSGYGDNTNPETRNFDGDFLFNGDFMIVYDDFSWTPKYRIWNGESWSNERSIKDVGGWPVWMIFDAAENNNSGMLVVRDAWEHTNTIHWNGASWQNIEEHGWLSTGFSRKTISYVWSLKTPDVGALMFNEWYDREPDIRIWRANDTWSDDVENRSVNDIARVMEIVARPKVDSFLGCVKDSGADITCYKTLNTPYWYNLTNSQVAGNTDDGDQRSFDLGYEQLDGEDALIVYSNGSNDLARRIPKYRVFDADHDSFGTEKSMSPLGSSASYALETVRVIPQKESNNIMVLLGDSDQDLNSILWNGSNNTFASSGDMGMFKHAQNGSNDLDYWYDFVWND